MNKYFKIDLDILELKQVLVYLSCDGTWEKSYMYFQTFWSAGEGKIGTDEAEFNRILSAYSYPLLRCVFEEYRKIKGKTFGDAIDSELSGDLKLGMKTICKYCLYDFKLVLLV